jgi:hypothetical protein
VCELHDTAGKGLGPRKIFCLVERIEQRPGDRFRAPSPEGVGTPCGARANVSRETLEEQDW